MWEVDTVSRIINTEVELYITVQIISMTLQSKGCVEENMTCSSTEPRGSPYHSLHRS